VGARKKRETDRLGDRPHGCEGLTEEERKKEKLSEKKIKMVCPMGKKKKRQRGTERPGGTRSLDHGAAKRKKALNSKRGGPEAPPPPRAQHSGHTGNHQNGTGRSEGRDK